MKTRMVPIEPYKLVVRVESCIHVKRKSSTEANNRLNMVASVLPTLKNFHSATLGTSKVVQRGVHEIDEGNEYGTHIVATLSNRTLNCSCEILLSLSTTK